MTQQLSLDGFAAGHPPTDRLFLGIFPPPAVAARLERLAHGLRSRHALSGKPLTPDRFHITLFNLGDSCGLPEAKVRSALEAAATVVASPFEVGFHRTESFQTKSFRLPLVLRAGTDADRLMIFQQCLGDALRKTGLGRYVGSSFTPHITLLYDPQTVPGEAVEPVAWQVREFVLVHSLLGQRRHIHLERWLLRA